MTTPGSITNWIDRLKEGDPEAAQRLWQRYFSDLVRLAQQKLRGTPRGVADEEDVALSAFNSLFEGVENGRFPQLNDRDDLWRLLVVIAARKAIDQHHRETAQKRGSGKVVAASAAVDSQDTGPLIDFASVEPTPAMAAQLADDLSKLYGSLKDDHLRQLAELKLQGFTNEEIANRIGCARRTVQRRLRLIQEIWQEETRSW